MDPMQVLLTNDLKYFVERQAEKKGFSSAEDFVQSVLVDLEKKERAKNDLEEKLREGLRSPLLEADEAFWRDMEQAFLEKHPELKSCDDYEFVPPRTPISVASWRTLPKIALVQHGVFPGGRKTRQAFARLSRGEPVRGRGPRVGRITRLRRSQILEIPRILSHRR